MSRLRRLVHGLYNAFRPERGEQDLAREVASHLSLLEDEFQRRGMTADEARLAARRAFGGVEQAKELQRDARSFRWLDDARRDVRYAAQLLRRTPVFAVTATLSLAIGIGATTTIFTVANELLLRAPDGVADPDRLVDIYKIEDGNAMAAPFIPFQIFLDLSREATSLDGFYAYKPELQPISMREATVAERIFANTVTPSYFTVLGVAPAAGRFFADGEADAALVILSHAFWTHRFNADPSIVGRTLWLNGAPFTVSGIASAQFRGTSVVAPDVWVSTTSHSLLNPGSLVAWTQVMGGARRRPGVSFEQAAAEIDVLGSAIFRKHPRFLSRPGAGRPTEVRPRLQASGASRIPGTLRRLVAGFIALLMGLVATVLVIACANLAGVLLARAAARRREIAVRVAIGAGRARIIRQLLTETLLLFAIGGAAGLLLARWATTVIVAALMPAFSVPVNVSLPLDTRVIAFAMGVSLIAAVLSGLAPALQGSQADVVTALKDEAQGPADRMRLRNAFVIAQIAFSIVLVVAGGLLGRALQRVGTTDRGYDRSGIELASVDLGLAGYTEATGAAFVRTLIDRLRQLPAIQAASVADRAPNPGIVMMMFGDRITVPGVNPPNGQPYFTPNWTAVHPGYFAALRIPLEAGRDFNAEDRGGAPLVAIVSESSARTLWPGRSAIGKSIVWQSGRRDGPSGAAVPPVQLTVIGVAGDGKSERTGRDAATVAAYVPLQQRYRPTLTIITRAAGGRRVGNDLRALVQSIDPNLPILAARTLEDELTGPVERQLRIAASVSGSVGLVSLLLAAIGMYGVTAYVAARRTREIGIRLALGARRVDVLRMILRQGMALVAMGATVGLLLAAAGSRLLTRLLFGVPPLDPLTFGGAAALFAVIGLAACYVPARRATNIDPVVALRCE